MKRHEGLIPLSRFHRSILFLALIAKKNAPTVKGYPSTFEGKVAYALRFYRDRLRPHFELEEGKLIPGILHRDDELDTLAQEIIDEHQLLHRLFSELNKAVDTETALNELGLALEKHVRKEERQFFQKIQEVLTSQELEELKTIYL